MADQTYTQFHEVIRSNCQTKVVFETLDGPCRLQVARDFGLDSEQQLFLRELSFGEPNRKVLVQLATYPRPFLMTLPNWHKPTEPTFYRPPDLPWTPLPEEKLGERKERNRDKITHEMDRYLGIIANNPFLMETEYDEIIRKKFGAHSRRKGTRIRQDLKDAGLLEEHPINLYRPGKQIKIAMPTKAGYEYLDRRGITYKIPRGNGGIEHKFWQHTVAKWLEKRGWTAEIEGSLKAKQVDVAAVKNHGLITEETAYEVVWEDLQKEVSNLEKDLADGWGRVIFCIDTEETRERLAKVLAESVPESDDRVEIKLFREFF